MLKFLILLATLKWAKASIHQVPNANATSFPFFIVSYEALQLVHCLLISDHLTVSEASPDRSQVLVLMKVVVNLPPKCVSLLWETSN
jgi:hypothetical protein